MPQIKKNSRLGDASVDGLLAGLAGGVVMAVFLVVMGLMTGIPAIEMLGLFSPNNDGDAAVGAVSHLAVSGIYGGLFGVMMLAAPSRVPKWLLGLLFGLALYVLAQYVLLPQSESALRALESWVFGAAHLLYGLVVALVNGRGKSA